MTSIIVSVVLIGIAITLLVYGSIYGSPTPFVTALRRSSGLNLLAMLRNWKVIIPIIVLLVVVLSFQSFFNSDNRDPDVLSSKDRTITQAEEKEAISTFGLGFELGDKQREWLEKNRPWLLVVGTIVLIALFMLLRKLSGGLLMTAAKAGAVTFGAGFVLLAFLGVFLALANSCGSTVERIASFVGYRLNPPPSTTGHKIEIPLPVGVINEGYIAQVEWEEVVLTKTLSVSAPGGVAMICYGRVKGTNDFKGRIKLPKSRLPVAKGCYRSTNEVATFLKGTKLTRPKGVENKIVFYSRGGTKIEFSPGEKLAYEKSL